MKNPSNKDLTSTENLLKELDFRIKVLTDLTGELIAAIEDAMYSLNGGVSSSRRDEDDYDEEDDDEEDR